MAASIQPTAEQWQQIEERLSHPYGSVKLKIDGYDISLQVKPIGPRRQAIAVYVNGWIKGKWLGKSCPERDRFCCPKEKSLHTKKAQASFIKVFGKRRAEKYGYMKKLQLWYPYWTSFRRLKSHLVKHNERIELIDDVDHQG